MSDISFDIEGILAYAQKKSGLEDFGSDDFKEGLQTLCETYDNNGYNEEGRKKNRKRLQSLLMARLRIEDAWKRHPEIRQEKITQPMFLTGLPRTGTSALLNLLASDAAARPLKLWEGLNPDPIDGLKPGEEDPRYVGMRDFYKSMEGNSDFDKIHKTSADTPEECIHLLNHTFQDVQYGVETLMEPYASWFVKQDLRPSYHYYADILRMLQWQRPGDRWLLKTPGHLWALDILVEMFPDCSIVITHRNPLECVTSYASMMAAMMDGRDFDKRALGPVVLNYLALKMDHSLKCREGFSEHRVVDIQFNDFVSAPLATVNTIYEHFKLPMTDATRDAMATYASDHPMGKHGSHDYDLEAYGLSEQTVLDRFGSYIERFDIPMD